MSKRATLRCSMHGKDSSSVRAFCCRRVRMHARTGQKDGNEEPAAVRMHATDIPGSDASYRTYKLMLITEPYAWPLHAWPTA
jgi:hypothetical protein